jgi:hypothetical protein
MSKRSHRHRLTTATTTLVAVAVVLVSSGCAADEEKVVCSGPHEHYVLVPSISKTDYDVSLEMTPLVAREVVDRAARSCGRVTVGIQDGRPEANLELQSTTLTPEPKDEEVFDLENEIEDLAREGRSWVQEHLLVPLNESEAKDGSPFLSALAKIGDELAAHRWQRGTIALVGDGLVVERRPSGQGKVRFGQEPITQEVKDEFVPLLRSLHGSCVMLVGAGATSKLPANMLRASQKALGEILDDAEVDFVATRSPELPPGC